MQDSEVSSRWMSIIEAGGFKPEDFIVLGSGEGKYSGNHFDFISFDEIANIQLEVPPAPKITYGPERKGKKGKLKRW